MTAESNAWLVLAPGASQARQRYGPTAWAVLEEMLQRGVPDGGFVLLTASHRCMAGWVGLSKDTVGRAVQRLRRHEVVTIETASADAGTPSRYRVHLARLPIQVMILPSSQQRAS